MYTTPSSGRNPTTTRRYTIVTGVPTLTRLYRAWACSGYIRIHPCDTYSPTDDGALVAWIPYALTESPIHRSPSGLSGPGGTGFSSGAHEGGNHVGFFALLRTVKAPVGASQ